MCSVTMGAGWEDGMTVCGLLRLDGADVRRSELTGMLAASSIGLPAARRVHLDGSFGVVTAADDDAGPMPPVLVGPSGLVIVIADHCAGAKVVPVARAARVRAGNASPSRLGEELARPATPVLRGLLGRVGRQNSHDDQNDQNDQNDQGDQGGEAFQAGRSVDAASRTARPAPGRSAGGSVTVLRPAAVPAVLSPALPRCRAAGDERPRDESRREEDRDGGTGLGGRGEHDHSVRVASALMCSYNATGQRALGMLSEHLLAVVWEPARRRLIVSRGGSRADDLVIRSDGRYFAFGVEPAQVLAAGLLGPVRPRRLAAGETLPVTVATRLRRPLAAKLPHGRPTPAELPVT